MRIAILLSALLFGCGSDGASPPAGAAATGPDASTQRRVAFIGDSITEGWALPADYINAGVGGNSTSAMLARFDRDVLRHEPDVIAILGGTNDVRFIEGATIASLTAIAERASQTACVIVGTIPPIEQWEQWTPYTKAQGDGLVRAWNDAIRDLAASRGYFLADYHAALSHEGEQITDLFADGVHPNDSGHFAMWLKAEPQLRACGVTAH